MNHRAEVGPAKWYDLIGGHQFCIMYKLGLREEHKLLDFGCGSLRGGRLFIIYLNPGNYYGVEPNTDLIDAGIKQELGESAIKLKNPTFFDFDDFNMSGIGVKFDFIIAQSVLSHAGNDLFEKAIKEAARSLRPGGTFAASFFEGPLRYQSGWLGHGISQYPISHVRSLGTKYGMNMRLLKDICPGFTHPNGQRWAVFTK